MSVLITVGAIVLIVGVVVARSVAKFREIEEENEVLVKIASSLKEALDQYANTYELEECDKRIIEDCKKQLKCEFGENLEIAKTYSEMKTMEERERFTIDIVHKIAAAMGVDVGDISFEEWEDSLYGTADSKGNIRINKALLVENQEKLINTICHELRHLLQQQSLIDDKWGFSVQRKEQWLTSINNYVNGFMGYERQIIEVDARKFAEMILLRK